MSLPITMRLVRPGAPPSALDFESRWDHATGTSEAAITNDGQWTGSNIGENVEVVTGASAGFPTGSGNALRIDYQGTTARTIAVTNQWAMPSVGQYISRRIIMRNDHTGSMYPAATHHPVWISNGVNACSNFAHEWFFYRVDGEPTKYLFEVATLSNGTDLPLYRWRCTTQFDVGTVYQVEERWLRVTSETYNLDIRVWNAAGNTLLYDSTDFTDNFNSAGLLSQIPAPSILMPSTCGSGTQLRNLQFIDQGVDFGAASYIYYGAVGIRISDAGFWVGPVVA